MNKMLMNLRFGLGLPTCFNISLVFKISVFEIKNFINAYVMKFLAGNVTSTSVPALFIRYKIIKKLYSGYYHILPKTATDALCTLMTDSKISLAVNLITF